MVAILVHGRRCCRLRLRLSVEERAAWAAARVLSSFGKAAWVRLRTSLPNPSLSRSLILGLQEGQEALLAMRPDELDFLNQRSPQPCRNHPRCTHIEK